MPDQLIECRLCHRIGHRGFTAAGIGQWECRNDRACARRVIQRIARSAA